MDYETSVEKIYITPIKYCFLWREKDDEISIKKLRKDLIFR